MSLMDAASSGFLSRMEAYAARLMQQRMRMTAADACKPFPLMPFGSRYLRSAANYIKYIYIGFLTAFPRDAVSLSRLDRSLAFFPLLQLLLYGRS